MRNCDSCINFIKIKNWHSKRKGLCEALDISITNTKKHKSCEYYYPKKYKRKNINKVEI